MENWGKLILQMKKSTFIFENDSAGDILRGSGNIADINQ